VVPAGTLSYGLERFLHRGISLLEIEALAHFKADALQPRDDRLIGDVWRVEFEQLCRVGEELTADMGSP
jgi:hypothetical protein